MEKCYRVNIQVIITGLREPSKSEIQEVIWANPDWEKKLDVLGIYVESIEEEDD